jgi:hypothetical protein
MFDSFLDADVFAAKPLVNDPTAASAISLENLDDYRPTRVTVCDMQAAQDRGRPGSRKVRRGGCRREARDGDVRACVGLSVDESAAYHLFHKDCGFLAHHAPRRCPVLQEGKEFVDGELAKV